jgi:hypothetical protein
MSTFEEDSGTYSSFTSDDSSLSDSDAIPDSSWVSESCLNESPITLMPYDEDDLDNLFTIKLPDKNGKFRTGSCLTREEFSQSLLSDVNSERPEYIMSVYTTPVQETDLLTGFSGKPTVRLVIRVPSNQIYITLGSAKRIFTEPTKTWYALPLFGGKRRRLGNILGTYGSSMNHGQVPGFLVYKLFTREEIKRGAQSIDTLEDYFVLPDQLHLLPFFNGLEGTSVQTFTLDVVYAIIDKSPDNVLKHNLEGVKAIAAKDDILAVANHSDVVLYNMSSKQTKKINIMDIDKNFFDTSDDIFLDFYKDHLYIIGGYKICILDNRTGQLLSKQVNIKEEPISDWIFSNNCFVAVTEEGIQTYQQLNNPRPSFTPSDNTISICSYNNYVYTGHSNGHINVWEWDDNKTLTNTKTFETGKQPQSLLVVKDNLYVNYNSGVLVLDPMTGKRITKVMPDEEYISDLFTSDSYVFAQEENGDNIYLILYQQVNKRLFSKYVIGELADMYTTTDDLIFFQKGTVVHWKNTHDLITKTRNA